MTAPVGVLAMAYGTAAGPEDIERYYIDIRGGRAPSPEHLQELRERYEAIGNRFPLLETTRRQAEGLEQELNGTAGAGSYRVFLGMKHSPPFVADGVAEMRRAGIERGVGLVLAPHWAAMSVETYVERVERATAADGGPSFTFIRHWHDHPGFLDFLTRRVEAALHRLSPQQREEAWVAFSAHSLPVRTTAAGTRCKACDVCQDACRYVAGLRETADAVAVRLGLPSYGIAWQSQGRTADPWWGPSVEEVIREAASAGHPAVVVCSAGFVSDHLETLYDLDVEAKAAADRAGVTFVRTEMPNADPDFLRALADVVLRHVEAEPPGSTS